MAILSIVDEEYLTSYTARRRNTVNETCKQKLCIIVSFKKMNLESNYSLNLFTIIIAAFLSDYLFNSFR